MVRYVCSICLGSGREFYLNDDDVLETVDCICVMIGRPPIIDIQPHPAQMPIIDAEFTIISIDAPAPAVQNSEQKDNNDAEGVQ